jgi:hypothetical protein
MHVTLGAFRTHGRRVAGRLTVAEPETTRS